jgi:hypothetical protein
VTVGLSYAESWISESCTQFCDATFPRGRLDPGQTQTFEMTIPVLPPSKLEALRQHALVYGYQDPDPDRDYPRTTHHRGDVAPLHVRAVRRVGEACGWEGEWHARGEESESPRLRHCKTVGG